MSRRVLQTERLKLRPLDHPDAADIARHLGDWQVIRWLTRPPWPYRPEDAMHFIAGPAAIHSRGIEVDGRLAGVISTGDGLGYWLGRPFWGRGLMREAAALLIADRFARCDDPLTSGYIPGNHASRRILTRLGFRPTHVELARSNPLDREVQVQKMALAAADWRQSHPEP